PASRRIRSATASAPAPTSRRMPTRQAGARSATAWCSRSSRARTGPKAAACASRATSSSPPTEPRSSPPSRTGSFSSARDLIWTGPINDPHHIGGSVGLYDTTLRDGEQTVGVVLDPEQKLEIARALANLGVERIEAGFPRVSQDDWDAVKLIADAGLEAEVWGFSRAVAADAEALVELGVQASVIESPISDAKLAALGVTRESMLGRIRDAVSFA